ADRVGAGPLHGRDRAVQFAARDDQLALAGRLVERILGDLAREGVEPAPGIVDPRGLVLVVDILDRVDESHDLGDAGRLGAGAGSRLGQDVAALAVVAAGQAHLAVDALDHQRVGAGDRVVGVGRQGREVHAAAAVGRLGTPAVGGRGAGRELLLELGEHAPALAEDAVREFLVAARLGGGPV